jgi:predicted esterase
VSEPVPPARAESAAPAPEAVELPPPVAEPPARAPLEPFVDVEPLPEVLLPSDWLVLQAVDGRGRRPFRPDAVFDRYLLLPDQPPPVANVVVHGELGDGTWQPARAGADGVLDVAPLHDAPLGWAYATAWSEAPRVMLAELRGASLLHVNGVPVPGDLYGLGTPGLPVALRAGRNDLLVSGCRGDVSLRFVAPPRRLFATIADATVPDVVDGQRPAPGTSAAVLVVNASLQDVPQLLLESGGPRADGTATPFEHVAPPTQLMLPALSVIKLPVPIMWHAESAPPEAGQQLRLPLRIGGHPEEEPQVLELPLVVRPAGAARRVTYVSQVDRSVQEFALVEPAGGAEAETERPGLVLALHGAGVDELAHAQSYTPQPDFWICAPTNRRPYGFDWQDWGRRDAYDALAEALVLSDADPARVMLTGHSMGGHGVWHLGGNDPDRFAALAPSAGWRSFDTYGSRPAGKLADLWRGADGASDTSALIGNLAQLPVFILHGTADDNVPVSEAQAMEEALRAAGGAPLAHYEEGAGHWWDGDSAPGVDCVDWPGIWELFRTARRPAEPDIIDWTAADPSSDARDHWVVLLQPLQYGVPCHVSAERRPAVDEILVATSNVRRLALVWPGGHPPARLVIDEQEIPRNAWTKPARHGQLLLEDGTWRALAELTPPAGEKTPERSGPLKRGFDSGFVLVYGTRGNSFENDSLLERARADASEWWYRGNGCAPLLSDDDWLRLAGTREFAGRNVVLYGNADSNGAWSAVLPAACPVQAHRGRIRVGERSFTGEDVAACFVYPRAGDEHALVAVFADSGPVGTRLLDTLTPFTSGVGYPDWAVFDSQVLADGDGGVLEAGWFTPAWGLGDVRTGRSH